MVGLLLVGLFCIQCISGNPNTDSTVAIAKTRNMDPRTVEQKLLNLAKTNHIALLEYCLSQYGQTYRDYTCTLIKQERINGKLGPEQEMRVKFKELPFSVAMQWTRNAPLGDRVLYVEGKYDNNMLVRPSNGFLRMLTGGAVQRKPDGPDAMRNTLRPVNLFGFRCGMEALVKVYDAARDGHHQHGRYECKDAHLDHSPRDEPSASGKPTTSVRAAGSYLSRSAGGRPAR